MRGLRSPIRGSAPLRAGDGGRRWQDVPDPLARRRGAAGPYAAEVHGAVEGWQGRATGGGPEGRVGEEAQEGQGGGRTVWDVLWQQQRMVGRLVGVLCDEKGKKKKKTKKKNEKKKSKRESDPEESESQSSATTTGSSSGSSGEEE